MTIYIYVYKPSYPRAKYKRCFLKQIICAIGSSRMCVICADINKCTHILTIQDYHSEINEKYPTKKQIIYTLQDNILISQKLLDNKSVCMILDHTKLIYDNNEICGNIESINGNVSTAKLSEHYGMIDTSIQKENINISNYMEKTRCVINMSHLYRKIFVHDVEPIQNRTYDIVFLGTINYGNNNISRIRTDVVEKIKNICHNKGLTYIAQSSIPIYKYYNILKSTKIFVSTYGWGEFSLKEFECICMGCHIIKVGKYFECSPNYYENIDNVRIDLSDFEEKITHLLSSDNISNTQLKVDKNRSLFLKNNYIDNIQSVLCELNIT